MKISKLKNLADKRLNDKQLSQVCGGEDSGRRAGSAIVFDDTNGRP